MHVCFSNKYYFLQLSASLENFMIDPEVFKLLQQANHMYVPPITSGVYTDLHSPFRQSLC